MVFKRFFNKFSYFFVFITLCKQVELVYAAQAAQANTKIAAKYALVLKTGKNDANFKAATKGGAGFGPQGRLLTESARAWTLNEEAFKQLPGIKSTEYPWRYAVAVSCRREGRAPLEIIQRFVDLLPQEERHRVAVILNINEKIVGFDERNRTCENLNELISERDVKVIQSYRIPVLVIYSQWTSYREDANNPNLTADKVRENIYKELDTLRQECQKQYEERLKELRQHRNLSESEVQEIRTKSFKNYQEALGKLNEETLSSFKFASGVEHKLEFPFGAMRTFLVANSESQKFIKRLHADGAGVFINLQDSDFTRLEVLPQFYPFGAPSIKGMDSKFLFKRYDALIAHCFKQNGCMPVALGGAYAYDPHEPMGEQVSPASKHWSQFAIEATNLTKFVIWAYGPYGVRFQEPNTMLLLHAPRGREVVGGEQFNNLLESGKIKFGPVCEIEDFTRELFKKCSNEVLHKAMIFSPELLVATSMKSDKRGFNVPFAGSFDPKTNRFILTSAADTDVAQDSLAHVNNMRQGVSTPRRWKQATQTAFKHCKRSGATCLEKLFKCFDPYYLSMLQGSCTLAVLAKVLFFYNQVVQNQQATIRQCQMALADNYNFEAAQNMLSCAWESGQGRRLLLQRALQLPTPERGKTQEDVSPLIQHFQRRFAYYQPDLPIISAAQEQFYSDLVVRTPTSFPVSPERRREKVVCDLIGVLLGQQTQEATAKVLGTSSTTLGNLKRGKGAPQTVPKIFDLLLSSQDALGLDETVFQELQTRARALQQLNTNKPAAKQEVTQQTVTTQTTPTAPTNTCAVTNAALTTQTVRSASSSEQALGTASSIASTRTGSLIPAEGIRVDSHSAYPPIIQPQNQSSTSASSRCATSSSFGSSALAAVTQIAPPKVVHRLPATDKELACEIAKAVYVAQGLRNPAAQVLGISVSTLDRLLDPNKGAPIKGPEIVEKFKKSNPKGLQKEWGLTKSQVEELKKFAGYM